MTTHIVALPDDPDELDVRYLGDGALELTYNRMKFRVGNNPEVKHGSLQLTLLAADVEVLTSGIGRIIAEESRKREP